ncbi:hypothetical protein [Nitrosomonas mobilis]|nr:hypothetical protein [Nitrosomonas mobilis]
MGEAGRNLEVRRRRRLHCCSVPDPCGDRMVLQVAFAGGPHHLHDSIGYR